MVILKNLRKVCHQSIFCVIVLHDCVLKQLARPHFERSQRVKTEAGYFMKQSFSI